MTQIVMTQIVTMVVVLVVVVKVVIVPMVVMVVMMVVACFNVHDHISIFANAYVHACEYVHGHAARLCGATCGVNVHVQES